MLFNTWTFAVFFLAVFYLYVRIGHRTQNRMLLVASYLFYGWWDARFLALIFLSTVLDYTCGLIIHGSSRQHIRRRALVISIAGNLGILGFFKYWNFFSGSLESVLATLGVQADPITLQIILPIGISFYTFQTMSYTIDIYRGEMRPTRSFLDFALFVAFFPQLVAGPIERAKRLLPQILRPRRVTLAQCEQGGYLIFWGLFQKIYVADNLAKIVDSVFGSPVAPNGAEVLVALYAFAFQILCDFAGYSNIARGVARCLGFDIMVNFRWPYFAADPAEFWRRWHISLSTWLRDYLYIPLGGNRRGWLRTFRNIMITMLLGGLWHGASWTFVLWGGYHGLLIVGYRLLGSARQPVGAASGRSGRCWAAVKVIVFFHLVCAGWLLFRAESVSQAVQMAGSVLFHLHIGDLIGSMSMWWGFSSAVGILLLVDWWEARRNTPLSILKWPPVARWGFYTLVFHLMVMYGAPAGRQFIYFQF